MPVRSQLQQRKEEEAARERHWAAQLAAHKRTEIETPDPVALAARLAKIHRPYVFRDPAKFNRRVRTKSADRIRLIAAEHVFGKYPVARHVRSVWIAEANPRDERSRLELALRLSVYLTAASGGSVHKACTGEFMTKKETHRFLNLSHTDSFTQAVWFALACSHTSDLGVAKRAAFSRLTEHSYLDPFWREALRFFCANPVPIARMNDVIDFLRQERARNPNYSLKGRTLASVAQQVEQWHRAIHRARRMGNATWEGADLVDAIYHDQSMSKDRRVDWRFIQIKTSQALAEEGTAMHHCVYAYQQMCISGAVSIWSLKQRPATRNQAAAWSRALTIEMDNARQRLVQLRGYANRPMNADERQIVSRWAADNGLSVNFHG